MSSAHRFLAAPFVAALVLGCGEPGALETTSQTALALDVCAETVPENRHVDGIPAYAQCDLTMESSIWSNNGIDTSTTSLGADWVQTQRSGGYQCTELVYRYMRFRWNVSYRSGNAAEWCDGTLPSNLVKSTVPVHGDLIVFAGGVCGADATTGHIAVVDTVEPARATATIVEENRAGRRSVNQSCATCFLHAVNNDGSSGGAAGAGGSPGGGSGGSGTAGSSSGGMGIAGMTVTNGGAAGVSTSAGSTGVSGSPATGGSAGTGDATGGTPSGTGGGAGGSVSGSAGQPASGGTSSETADHESALDEDAGCSVSPHGTRHTSLGVVALGLLLALVGRRRRPSRARGEDACGAAYNSGLRSDLEKRAEFDLRCAPSELQFFELSSANGLVTSYGVKGCGRQVTYVLNTGSLTWVLNSETVDVPKSSAGRPATKSTASATAAAPTSASAQPKPAQTSSSDGFWK